MCDFDLVDISFDKRTRSILKMNRVAKQPAVRQSRCGKDAQF